jgi:hypothetical protein
MVQDSRMNSNKRGMDRKTKKYFFFQERLFKSAANFNESLTAAKKVNYKFVKITRCIIQKRKKKEQLKNLKQEDTERVRDFRIRIDDYYKIAFGEGAVTSEKVTVIALRNEKKKDVLLNGLKTAISELVWNRPNIHNATYAQALEMAEEIEKYPRIKT